jgi:hypothetical protein
MTEAPAADGASMTVTSAPKTDTARSINSWVSSLVDIASRLSTDRRHRQRFVGRTNLQNQLNTEHILPAKIQLLLCMRAEG